MAGFSTFYFLHPVMDYKFPLTGGPGYLMAAFSGGLALAGTTGFFQKHSNTIALFSMPLILLQVITNVALSYEWVDQGVLWSVLANTMSIPLAIVWYFILKHKSSALTNQIQLDSYSIASVFSGNAIKLVAGAIVLISGILFFYRLGYYDIWEDEDLVINAAKGVYENGFSYFEEGYKRTWLHTIICAGVFNIFGISEFTGRIPSAVFGILFVVSCFYVFARWYGLAWLALLIPIICLMNDRFLILFRYMRMYALLIPLFLIGVYVIYKAIGLFRKPPEDQAASGFDFRKWGLIAIAILFLPLLGHMHKLAMVLLPVIGLFILYIVLLERGRNQLRLLWITIGGMVVLMFFAFVVELESLKMFRQVASRLFTSHPPMTAYYAYVFENGLPLNSTLMLLLAGLGLLGSQLSRGLKSLLVFNYLLITIALVSMVYLVEGDGRDYRYTAHIVPFVVCTLLLVVYFAGRIVWKGSYPWTLVMVFIISSLKLMHEYEKVYVRHPWAPRYSVVYNSLKTQYKPGDAFFATNVKSYYLKAVDLAGTHYHKVPKRKEYTMEQFQADIKAEGHGWFLWELHKSHHLRKEIIEYIYRNFRPVHNSRTDEFGVELFYFDETMIR